jgi:tetratricopeptide (TPR) repeat protein
MRRYFAPLAVLLVPVAAIAANPNADKPIIGPPPPWVRPNELPADTGKPDESAVRLLLSDQQRLLLPNGNETYTETALRVQTAQGLSALGTLTLAWKPDLGTLTVHKLRIIRDGKVIDLLAGGPGFTVVRRENNLEYAMLDGILTAVIQPEGLQVGDILDMATTTKTSDPTLGGNSEGLILLGPAARAAHYRARLIWPDKLPIRWRQGEGMPPVRLHKADGQTELSLAMDDVQPEIVPKSAPPRFSLTRRLEATSLKSWNDLSALFAPLYAKAATLKPDSPIKAEISRIAGASPDPVRRAEAALALTQDRLRYVFLGMNDGNLVPADADTTWQRRFADCKGKTAFLLALLHGLGIEAVPAIVSTALGDGMDAWMPQLGLFNHVIVRATIDGKVYWLDGTRTGDVRLADIRVPDFGFALPLRTPGVALERLDVPVPVKPLDEYWLKVDMRAGVTRPFPFHVEEVSRGDGALATHLRLDNMTPDVRQQSLRDYFAGQYPDVEIKTSSASWDPATREERLVMDGLEKHDWRWSYEADHAGIGWKADFERAVGPHRDAPFQVDYPSYTVAHETILLPNNGRGMVNQVSNVDRTVGGVEYRRTAKMEGEVFTIETSSRAVAREYPAKDASAAQAALRELAAQQPLLALNADYRPTPQEIEASIADPKSSYDYFARAQDRLHKRDLAGALADAEQSVALSPDNAGAYLLRGSVRDMMGKPLDALPDMQKAVAIAPAWQPGHVTLANLLMNLGRNDEALAEAERAVLLDVKDHHALAMRGEIQRRLRHYDQALADTALALAKSPEKPLLLPIYQTRINAYLGLNKSDKAIAEAQALVAADPGGDQAHVLAGATYARFGRRGEAMAEFARAIAIKPSTEAYLTRANNRAPADIAGKRADIAAALTLDPKMTEAKLLLLNVEYKAGNPTGVIAGAEAILRNNPTDATALMYRGLAYAATKHAAEAVRDFDAARKSVATDAPTLNNMCWAKAKLNVALDAALADCDAAVKLWPKESNMADSRAFVLFRMGRFADALVGYDQALQLSPDKAASLYMRGIVKHRLGKAAEGDADIAAARAIDSNVDREFTDAGVTT